MAHRSDREPGHPAECRRHQACKAEWDPSSRIPSGPAVNQKGRTNRPDRRLHPTSRHNVKSPLATREPSTEDIHPIIHERLVPVSGQSPSPTAMGAMLLPAECRELGSVAALRSTAGTSASRGACRQIRRLVASIADALRPKFGVWRSGEDSRPGRRVKASPGHMRQKPVQQASEMRPQFRPLGETACGTKLLILLATQRMFRTVGLVSQTPRGSGSYYPANSVT
jgi:hypothetical protein